ncbi:Uncharacterized protein APZ42_004428 [Daphnia magna]|uniref:Uncharacterized protein n=1 Tax=Daphnia magna TaxID=35525 RepID=A0A162CV52_9CRUS|nr:Uncharacterized protein APZ42_004428 [Daphnia magna]
MRFDKITELKRCQFKTEDKPPQKKNLFQDHSVALLNYLFSIFFRLSNMSIANKARYSLMSLVAMSSHITLTHAKPGQNS